MTDTTPPLSLDALSLDDDLSTAGSQSSHPAAATLSSPVLAHHMFPHIIDKIVDAAPYESLLALRSTSWDFCNRVDWLLARHVIMRGPDASDDVWDNPGRPYHYTHFMTTTDNKRLPFLHQFHTGQALSAKAISRLRNCLKHTRFIDVYDDLSWELYHDEVRGGADFTGLEWLKLHLCHVNGFYDETGYFAGQQWFPRVGTFVTFVRFFCNRWNRLRYITTINSYLPALPHIVERIVITVTIPPADTCHYMDEVDMLFIRIGDYPQSLREAVFIFGIIDSQTMDDDEQFMTSDDKGEFYGIDAIVDFNRLGHLRYTLVDICSTYPEHFGLPKDTAPAQIEDMVHAQVWQRLRDMQGANGWSDEVVARKAAAFETISRSAYEARVGNDEQFNFETAFNLELAREQFLERWAQAWPDG